jgi:site-specific DNA recombinase
VTSRDSSAVIAGSTPGRRRASMVLPDPGGPTINVIDLVDRYDFSVPVKGNGSPGPPKSAAIYCRISDDPRGERLGVARQEEDCRALAERKGWPIGGLYVDNDVSAYSGRHRPEYRRMLADLKSGERDAVIVYHLDRLFRRPLELEEFIEACETAGVTHTATVAGDFNLGSDDALLSARILTAVARKESDDKRRRLKRKHLELARNGRALGGVTTPLGYIYDPITKEMAPDPEKAAVVVEIFERYASGWSLKSIARDLTDRGIVGLRGRTLWSNGAIARILDNPTYAAYRHYEDDFTEGNWPPLIGRELWHSVEALRTGSKAPSAAQNRLGKGTNLLSGLLYCSCGSLMWRDTYAAHPQRSSYVCSRAARKHRGDCRAGGISAERAEKIVTERFLVDMTKPWADVVLEDVPDEAFFHNKEEGPSLDDRAKALEKKVELAVEMMLDAPAPTAKTLRAKVDRLTEELEALEVERKRRQAAGMGAARGVADLKALRGQAADLPAIWEEAGAEERTQALKALFERIVVLPGPRPKQLEFVYDEYLRFRIEKWEKVRDLEKRINIEDVLNFIAAERAKGNG